MNNQRKNGTLVLCLFFLGFICSRNILAQNLLQEEKYVSVSGTQVPINESSRRLITGVDLNRMLSRYIDDFDAFERQIGSYSFIHGLKSIWLVKPIPGDSSTDYFYGKRRNEPFFKRVIDITIAIAKSHRNALVTAGVYYHNCSTPPFISYSSNNPGFVSLHENQRVFVLDNLFVALTISGDLDSKKIIELLIEDLKNGGDGVFKGDPITPPSLSYDGPLSNLSPGERYKIVIPIQAVEPNHRLVALGAEINNIEYSNSKSNPKPTVSVNEAGQIEFRYKGSSFSADLIVNAVNDLGVVSETWIRRIQVNGE